MTTLLVRKETRDALKSLGAKGETYDQILQRLIAGGGHKSAAQAQPATEEHAKGYA